MIRLSANLGFLWPDLQLVERIAAAGAAGFAAVELHSPYDVEATAVAAACRQANVTLVAINTPRGPRPGDSGLAAVPGREADFDLCFDQALAFSVAAGAPKIHTMAGVTPDTAASEAVLVENLRRAAAKADRVGRVLLLEALNPHDGPGYFYSRVERVVEIINAVDRPNVRLMFDVYHVGRGQGEVLARLERCFPFIGHVQIAAVPSRAEPDESTVDYRTVFAALEQLGYDGWVGCEYRPRADTDAGLKWRREFGLDPAGN